MVVLREPVFDAPDRICVDQMPVVVDQPVPVEAFVEHPVGAVALGELVRCRIERDRHLIDARLVAGGTDRSDQQVERFLRGGNRRCEAALVAEAEAAEPVLNQGRESMVDVRADADGVGHRRRCDGGDHELLEVQLVRCVRAAVEDVEVRDRHPRRASGDLGDPLPERQVRGMGKSPGGGDRGRDDAVPAEPAVPGGAVEFGKGGIDPPDRRPRPAGEEP